MYPRMHSSKRSSAIIMHSLNEMRGMRIAVDSCFSFHGLSVLKEEDSVESRKNFLFTSQVSLMKYLL